MKRQDKEKGFVWGHRVGQVPAYDPMGLKTPNLSKGCTAQSSWGGKGGARKQGLPTEQNCSGGPQCADKGGAEILAGAPPTRLDDRLLGAFRTPLDP